jgi:hypothetical protein
VAEDWVVECARNRFAGTGMTCPQELIEKVQGCDAMYFELESTQDTLFHGSQFGGGKGMVGNVDQVIRLWWVAIFHFGSDPSAGAVVVVVETREDKQ